jgi:ornithine cyclodeaminase/alanine dehydrogenase
MTLPLWLPDERLQALDIPPSEIADAIEQALRDKAAGRLFTTPKSAIMPGEGRYVMSTLSVGPDDLTVLKTVGVYPGNAARGMASITGAILVLDAQTGALKAVMGADWVTAVRTAGLSAVAARRLADPASQNIAFVGCGVQASSHLNAFRDKFPLRKVFAVGRGKANVERLCDEARAAGLKANHSAPEEALRAADIVVTSISLDYTIKPFLDANWLKPGAFAAVTDLFIPWQDETAAAFSTLVVDDLEQERVSEKQMVPADLITDDLTGLLSRKDLGHRPDARQAFVFRGLALGDYAAAALSYRRAVSRGHDVTLG